LQNQKNDTELKPLKALYFHLQSLVENRLWLKVIIALILGAAAGLIFRLLWGEAHPEISQTIGNWLALPGQLFLKLVQMIMIPLIFSSIITGIAGNDPAQLKKMGAGVLVYFIITTIISITIGTVLTLLIKPGRLLHQLSSHEHRDMLSNTDIENKRAFSMNDIPKAITDLLPENPLSAMVTGEMLPIVIFTIIIGVAVVTLSQELRLPVMKFLGAIQEICMTVVKWAMRIVPLAVFGLIAQLTATIGLQSLSGIGMYVAVVLLGLAILLGVYLFIVSVLAKKNPFEFLKNIRDAQLLAFSTTSSAAVMPLSLKTAEEKLNVHSAVSNFIIPIGATINMDGTALYQAVTTIFIAQVYGLEMSILSIVLVMITIVAASIGTPAIPGGGVVILASVLKGAGIPAEGIMVIIGVERILGMFRTTVNVTGDLTACVLFDRFHKQQATNDKQQTE